MTIGTKLLLLLAAVLSTSLANAEHWAVIVAGSRGYGNYRHQADACHAFHVVRRHGIPAENVVLMMYDDVVAATENPFPGKLFNRATRSIDDVVDDVYAGCHVDYAGEDVTPLNFLSVLRGNATATNGKKVLESGPNDRIFINFVDHGGRGFVVFPHGQMLTASQLTTTMDTMFKQKRYKELVVYVEACHSGSMFWSWSMSHISAFVTTASNGWESSWGTYCPPHDLVDGVALGTCLGDLYSVSWMEDSDKTDLSAESLEQQFRLVKRATSKSHVQQFGSSRVRNEIVGDFLSNYDITTAVDGSDTTHKEEKGVSTGAVDAHDIPLVLAFYKYLRSSAGPERSVLAAELLGVIQERQHADRLFQSIHQVYEEVYGETLQAVMATNSTPTTCDSAVFHRFGHLVTTHLGVSQASDMPLGFSSYSLQYAGVLTDLCARLETIDAVDTLLRRAIVSPQELLVQVQ